MKTKVLGLVAAALLAGPAHATVMVTIQQVGSNVVMSGSGTANLAGLGAPGGNTVGAFATPQAGWFLVGPVAAGPLHIYQTAGAPLFGSGGVEIPTSGTGQQFGIIGASSLLAVPDNYISGAQLTGSSTFANQTLAVWE